MDPEVEVVGGFEDELVVVGVVHIAIDKLMRIFKNLIDIMTNDWSFIYMELVDELIIPDLRQFFSL